MYNHSEFGLWGEAQAAKFLRAKKLKILDKNYETSSGEIDIVCLQKKRSTLYQIWQLKRKLKKEKDKFTHEELQKLIAQKQYELESDMLVFIEVKTRSEASILVANPSEAVDSKKQNKYNMLAKQYMAKEKLVVPARFDIVEVVRMDSGKVEINHIENAF